jgi:hypothetical protein
MNQVMKGYIMLEGEQWNYKRPFSRGKIRWCSGRASGGHLTDRGEMHGLKIHYIYKCIII